MDATHGTSDVAMRVAVLGMGNMGRALAARLLSQGYDVFVWNRSPRDLFALTDVGAHVLPSLDSVWASADVALSFVADDDALRAICSAPSGILSEPQDHGLLIEMSTVSPKASEETAVAASNVGVAYLRSPVSGNPSVLAAGNLTLVVSGPDDVFQSVRTLLSAIGSNVLHVGEAEQARLVKLAINAGLAITTELLAELIVLTERYGLGRETFLDVLNQSVLGSAFTKYKSGGLNQRNYGATFTTALLAKDLRLALDLADNADLSLPAVALVSSLVNDALDGYADVDFAALLPHLQRTHGYDPDIPPVQDVSALR